VATTSPDSDAADVVARRDLTGDARELDVALVVVEHEVARHRVELRIGREPRHERVARDDAELQHDVPRREDRDLRLRVAGPALEDVDEVVPAQLRVVDLEHVAIDLHLQVLAGDARDLDACAGLVVGDHVDLAADEADLELAHELEVDDPALAGIDDPLLDAHVGFSFCCGGGWGIRGP
jgi:hypothetical protein